MYGRCVQHLRQNVRAREVAGLRAAGLREIGLNFDNLREVAELLKFLLA